MKVSALSAAVACLISDGAYLEGASGGGADVTFGGLGSRGAPTFCPHRPPAGTRVDGNKVAPEGQ